MEHELSSEALGKMDTREIVSLIKACRKEGVQELVYDKLRLVFFPSQPDQKENFSLVPNHEPVKVPPKVEEKMNVVGSEARAQDKKTLLEDEIEMLVVTDPLQYEELLETGELTDAASVQH